MNIAAIDNYSACSTAFKWKYVYHWLYAQSTSCTIIHMCTCYTCTKDVYMYIHIHIFSICTHFHAMWDISYEIVNCLEVPSTIVLCCYRCVQSCTIFHLVAVWRVSFNVLPYRTSCGLWWSILWKYMGNLIKILIDCMYIIFEVETVFWGSYYDVLKYWKNAHSSLKWFYK